MTYALGIDLGGSSVKGVVVTTDGRTLATSNVDFNPDTRLEWAGQIRSFVAHSESVQGGVPEAIGISAPGVAARDERSIAVMPGRLQGLEELDWTTFLKSPRPVPVLNDAHAALLGEAWLGAARGFQHVIMLTLGTGVGGAIISDGKLLRGAFGKGGHLGHVCLDVHGPPDVCGMPGSVEVAIGNFSIRERSGGRFETTHALVQAHRAGDAEATRVWLASVRALACAIGSFANILDPEAVIIGGGIARAGAALFEPLQRMLDDVEWRPGGGQVKLLPAALGELAGAYGAAWRGLAERGQPVREFP
jgi:glucokinase